MAPEPTPGGGGNLTLPAAGIDQIYFTDDSGGISVWGNNAEYALVPREDAPLFPLLAPDKTTLALTQGGAHPSLRIIAPYDVSIPLKGKPRCVAFSPNSRRVLFTTSVAPYTLEIISADGSEHKELASSETPIDASWLPDGNRVFYAGSGKAESVPQIFIADVMGEGRRQLTRGARPKSHPSVSPDGNRLAFLTFEAESGGVWRIELMHIPEENAERIELAFEPIRFNGMVPFSKPVWSPFGRFLGYSVFETEELARIEFIDTRDFTRHEVTDAEFGDVFVGWAPRRGFLTFARQIFPSWFLMTKFITHKDDGQFIMGPQKWPGYAVDWK